MFKIVLSLFLFLTYTGYAAEDIEKHQERMLTDLEFIQKRFEYGYAPAEWKKELFDWDVVTQMEFAKQKIRENKTVNIKEFQKILTDFTLSARDYHVTVLFASTESSSLPFDIRFYNGKYLITYVDEDESSLFNIGDEILTLDGIPVDQVVSDIQAKLFITNNPATDRSLALEFLTMRAGSFGCEVPQGLIKIEIKKKDSGKIVTRRVNWDYTPERIAYAFKDEKEKFAKRVASKMYLEKECSQNSIVPYYQAMSEAFPRNGVPRDLLGSRKSLLSNLGKENLKAERGFSFRKEETTGSPKKNISEKTKEITEDAKEFFDAKMIGLPSGKQAGFLRISTFSEDYPDIAMNAFLDSLALFQKQTDVLVLDLTNNPGGQVFYMYALASALTDRPLAALKSKKMLTQNEVFDAINIIDMFPLITSDEIAVEIFGETILGYPITYAFVQNKIQESIFILEQWELGRLNTEPFYEFGMEFIAPHPKVNYTKPILVLINEMDFSSAELLSAILQDNRRATLMGKTTAGAGGTMKSFSFTNLNGIKEMSYTASIVQRFDGTFIENMGVAPDIPFDFNDNCSFDEEGFVSYNIMEAIDDFANNSAIRR